LVKSCIYKYTTEVFVLQWLLEILGCSSLLSSSYVEKLEARCEMTVALPS
jgi:hypothetical protein